jgi:acyl-CoA synthetase (NDP forming)
MRHMASDPGLDALIVIFIPPLMTQPEDVARAIVDTVREIEGKKTVLTVFMSARGVPAELREADVKVPSFAFPEAAAIALAQVARYAEWRARPLPTPAVIEGLRRDDAARVVEGALRRGGGWLSPGEVKELLDCYGLPFIEQRVVAGTAAIEDAARAADELGGRVVLKAVAERLVHRSDVGAVRLNLAGAEQVRAAASEMAMRLRGLGAAPTGYVVQKMAAPGLEMLVGVVNEPRFGPVLACGAGGVLVELMGDVSVRVTPVTVEDAVEMLRSLKTYPLLTGYRGQRPADVDALIDVIVRTSIMADDLPAIAEMDCNPILVHERGATIVDARIRVAVTEPPLPLGARRS